MRLTKLAALAALAVPLAAGADMVLLIETSAGMERELRSIRAPAIAAGDRLAVMSFGGKPSLRQDFTADVVKLESAIRRLTLGGRHGGFPWSKPGMPREAPVFKAITAACRLFGPGSQAKRAVILLFGSEDFSEATDAARALAGTHAALYAVAVSKAGPGMPPGARTPPTTPGRVPGGAGQG
jgi:hypothetical protein